MSKVVVDITASLDGYVAGPDPSLEQPLGRGGEALHEWALAAVAWRERHGRSGGERNEDDAVLAAHLERIGATVMGRRMFSGGSGPWEDDPRARGWWGDEPPFGHPVFVLTHHAREPLRLGRTTFTFVTDGLDAALDHARAAAGGRDVHVAGGGSAVRQALAGGAVDELQLHVAPVLLGGGTPLLDASTAHVRLEPAGGRVTEAAAHLRYRVTGA